MVILFSVFLGATLAAAAGFRAFLPLFLLGLMQRFELLGQFALGDNFLWLASTPALICLGTATVLEIAADKFPAVDSALDTMMTFVRPGAGGLGVIAVLSPHSPLVAYVAGIVLAGGATLPIHLGKMTLRLGSHATTGGIGSPALSCVEDVAAGGTVTLALIVPVLAVVFGTLGVILVGWFLWRRRNRRPQELALA